MLVLEPAGVAAALRRLRERKVHPLFAGYLHLRRRAAELGRLDDLRPDFLEFHERFLSPAGHPLGSPYVKPFINTKPTERNAWLNENVAGSYAPSSIRPDKPFGRVVNVDKADRSYSLPPDHAELAARHLLYGGKINAADLAAVLYRDFGFVPSMTADDLAGLFAYEFGFIEEEGGESGEEFAQLFETPSGAADDLRLVPFGKPQAGTPTADDPPPEGNPERVSERRSAGAVRRLSADDLYPPPTPPAPPRIDSLTVSGLLSFGMEERFDFGRLNLLVGANGAGKSNLLDCLRVFQAAPIDISHPFRAGGFQEWVWLGGGESSSPPELSIRVSPAGGDPILHQLRLVPPESGRAQFSLEERIAVARGEGGESTLFSASEKTAASIVRSAKVRELKSHDSSRSVLEQVRDAAAYPELAALGNFYAKLRIYSEWAFGRGSALHRSDGNRAPLPGFVLRAPSPAGRLIDGVSEDLGDVPLFLDGVSRTRTHEKVREFLRNVKEQYVDFETKLRGPLVALELLENPGPVPVPATRLSDGTLRFLALAAILLHDEPPPVICLEEPELGMHPDMIGVLADMIADAKERTQLLVTTHSELLLDRLQDDFDVLFAFNATSHGTRVIPFDQEQFGAWREDHTLGELWTSGELGGNRW